MHHSRLSLLLKIDFLEQLRASFDDLLLGLAELDVSDDSAQSLGVFRLLEALQHLPGLFVSVHAMVEFFGSDTIKGSRSRNTFNRSGIVPSIEHVFVSEHLARAKNRQLYQMCQIIVVDSGTNSRSWALLMRRKPSNLRIVGTFSKISEILSHEPRVELHIARVMLFLVELLPLFVHRFEFTVLYDVNLFCAIAFVVNDLVANALLLNK